MKKLSHWSALTVAKGGFSAQKRRPMVRTRTRRRHLRHRRRRLPPWTPAPGHEPEAWRTQPIHQSLHDGLPRRLWHGSGFAGLSGARWWTRRASAERLTAKYPGRLRSGNAPDLLFTAIQEQMGLKLQPERGQSKRSLSTTSSSLRRIDSCEFTARISNDGSVPHGESENQATRIPHAV